jgi:hypothetical protein
MSWFRKKTLLRTAVTAFTVFAVILCLFLTGGESFGSAPLQTDGLSGEGTFFFLNQTGKAVIFSVTNSRSSFLRMVFLRSYALLGMNGAGDSVYALQFKSKTNDSKDLVPLKLRT